MYIRMYMAPDVRFFCMPGPKGNWWSDLSLGYLRALVAGGFNVRALPVGSVPIMHGGWREHAEQFTAHLGPDYTNVVCVRPAYKMGVKATGRSLADASPRGGLPEQHDGAKVVGAVDMRLTAVGRHASDEVVYEPQYALEGLWTKGRPNIAFTYAAPLQGVQSAEDCLAPAAELEALKHYDAVLVPKEADALVLVANGVQAEVADDAYFREQILRMGEYFGRKDAS